MLGFYNLKNRIGEEFLFLVNNKIGDDEFVKEIFLAMLIEFDGEYVIVRQKYTSTDGCLSPLKSWTEFIKQFSNIFKSNEKSKKSIFT